MKSERVFNNIAGSLLLAVGLALLVDRWATAGMAQPLDPLLGLRLSLLQWLAGVTAAGLGIGCLFGRRTRVWTALVLWFSGNFWIYALSLTWNSPRKFRIALGGVPETFGVSAAFLTGLAFSVFALLFVGSAIVLCWAWLAGRRARRLTGPDFLKVSCSFCGGHISFPLTGLGREIACPHCARTITLQTA
jgi:hypothetical protein